MAGAPVSSKKLDLKTILSLFTFLHKLRLGNAIAGKALLCRTVNFCSIASRQIHHYAELGDEKKLGWHLSR